MMSVSLTFFLSHEMDEQKRKEIIQLQQECPYFKNIYNFLKKGTLPDDQKRAYAF
jgi:uncharacterized OsmC-like protein